MERICNFSSVSLLVLKGGEQGWGSEYWYHHRGIYEDHIGKGPLPILMLSPSEALLDFRSGYTFSQYQDFQVLGATMKS